MIEIRISAETAEEVLQDLAALALTHTVSPTPAPAPMSAPAVATPATTGPIPAPPVAKTTTAPAPAPAAVQPPTASTPAYTFEMVGKAGADLVAANPGLMPVLMGMLQRYGVQLVTDLKPEQLGPFAAELRAQGAKI